MSLSELLNPNAGATVLAFGLLLTLGCSMVFLSYANLGLKRAAFRAVFGAPIVVAAYEQAFYWRDDHGWSAVRYENVAQASAIMTGLCLVVGAGMVVNSIEPIFTTGVPVEVGLAQLGFGLAAVYESGVIYNRLYTFASYGEVHVSVVKPYTLLLVPIFVILVYLIGQSMWRQMTRTLNDRSEKAFFDYLERNMQPYDVPNYKAQRREWLWRALCGIGMAYGAPTTFYSHRYYKRGD